VFNIFSYKEKANENYTKILSHPSKNGYLQENKQQQMPARMQGHSTKYLTSTPQNCQGHQKQS
jgi:hypothetical protein